MKNVSTFPDLAQSMKLMKISCDLELVSQDNIFGMAIQTGLRKGKLKDTILMIQSQAQDNRPLMADIVGENLLKDIEQIRFSKPITDSEGQLGAGC